MAGSVTVVSTSQQATLGICNKQPSYSTYEFRSDKENVDPSEGQKPVRMEAASVQGKGLKVRSDTWARRQAPLQDITAAHKHVSLSKDKLKALRMPVAEHTDMKELARDATTQHAKVAQAACRTCTLKQNPVADSTTKAVAVADTQVLRLVSGLARLQVIPAIPFMAAAA